MSPNWLISMKWRRRLGKDEALRKFLSSYVNDERRVSLTTGKIVIEICLRLAMWFYAIGKAQKDLPRRSPAEADDLAKAIGLVTASAVQDGFEAGWAAGMKSVEKTESD
jgi:hypothetical protein